MDPPIVPEMFSTMAGLSLERPIRADNRYLQAMVEETHQQQPFRIGDTENMPYTAYGPEPPSGVERLPPGVEVHNSHSNRLLMQDLQHVHHMQQANMQRQAHRQRKGAQTGGQAK